MTYICPACGYPELHEPAYDSNEVPSYEICESCGYQFGFTDDNLHISIKQWRDHWISNGMIWNKGRSLPPLGWNPSQQLLNIDVKV